jgi:putative transcriptional regulator
VSVKPEDVPFGHFPEGIFKEDFINPLEGLPHMNNQLHKRSGYWMEDDKALFETQIAYHIIGIYSICRLLQCENFPNRTPVVYILQKDINWMIEITLRTLLEKRKISMYKLSKDSGLPYQTIWRLSKSKQQSIDFSVLNKLCETLDCRVQDIIVYRKEVKT